MPKANLNWALDAHRLECTLTTIVEGGRGTFITYNAAELESLLHGLAKARATMAEEVPPDAEQGMRLEAVIDPRWCTENHGPNGAVFAFRHPGFGWLGVLFPPDEVRTLGESMLAMAEDMEAQQAQRISTESEAKP